MAPSGSGSKKVRANERGTSDRVSQMRREQQKKDRRRLMAIWGAAAATIAIVAGAVAFAVVNDKANTPSLADVKDYTYEAGAHTESAVTYKETPPVGGEHHPVWLNCGVYPDPVRSENAVHSLEHGAVWITYRPDLPAADVETLEDATPDTYALLSPFEGLPAPVVVSSWGHQLQLTGADDPRLEEFIKEYRQGPDTPEPGALCTNGTDGSDMPPPTSPSASPSTSTSPSASTSPSTAATPAPSPSAS